MSIDKSKQYNISMKDEIKETLKEKKLQIIGIIMFVSLWILGIIINETGLYTFLMIIFSILFVLYYASISILYETKVNIYFYILKKTEKVQELSDKIDKLSDEEIDKLLEDKENDEIKG